MSSNEPRAAPVVTSDRVWLSTLMYGSAEAEVAVVFGHGFTGSQHNRKVVAFVRHLADQWPRGVHRGLPRPRHERRLVDAR